MSYRDIKLIVPIEYKYGLDANQTANFFPELYDQDPNTSSSSVGTSGITDITLVNECIPKWLFVDSDAQKGTITDTGYFVPYRSATPISINSHHSEYGKSGAWSFPTGTSFKRNTSDSTTELSILLNLSNSTLATLFKVDLTATLSPSNTKRGYVWSEDFTVPLFNRDKKTVHSFDIDNERSLSGNSIDDWSFAQDAQVKRVHTFVWKGLTDMQMDVFDNFFDAFGGNINQPFIMVRMYNAGTGIDYEMQFWRLIIDERSIKSSVSRSSLHELSFSATELRVNY